MSHDASPLVISIRPEPAPEELVAIVAAVMSAVRENTQVLPYDHIPDPVPPSRWSRHGRLDALRGLDRHSDRDP